MSDGTFSLTVERVIDTPPDVVYHAFTDQLERWFAAPGSLVTSPIECGLYRFETEMDGHEDAWPLVLAHLEKEMKPA